MPFRRSYRKRKARKTARRSTYRRKRYATRRNRPSMSIMRGPSPMPDRMMTTFKYSGTYNFTGSAFTSRLYNGNSLYDPDRTGTGHQPRGYDELSAFYSQAKVWGSKIVVRFLHTSNTPCFCALVPQKDATALTALDVIDEMPYIRKSLVGITGSGSAIRTFRSYMSTKRIHGRRNLDDNYSHGTAANPAAYWTWAVIMGSLDGSTTFTGWVEVTLTYYATLYGRVKLSES